MTIGRVEPRVTCNELQNVLKGEKHFAQCVINVCTLRGINGVFLFSFYVPGFFFVSINVSNGNEPVSCREKCFYGESWLPFSSPDIVLLDMMHALDALRGLDMGLSVSCVT
jgi:hypothetical protein